MHRPRDETHPSWGPLLVGVAAAGGMGWLVDVTLLWILVTRLGVPTVIAAAAGFLSSGVVNYLLNRIVFRADGTHGAQGAKYLALFCANLVLVSAGVPLLADLLDGVIGRPGARLVVSKVVMTAVLLIPNTFFYRRWVFVSSPGGRRR